MPRIIIDAGHGGNDVGDLYERRKEKDDNLRLALAVGEFLKRKYLYNVRYTRTRDTYLSQMDRAELVNELGGDLLLSLHRIVGDIPVTPPSLCLYIRDECELSESVARHLGNALKEVGFSHAMLNIRTDLTLFKKTNLPIVMMEVGALNSERSNELFDSNFGFMVEKIAEGIVFAFSKSHEHSVLLLNPATGHPQLPIYRIRVGVHSRYQNAIVQQKSLMIKGYPAEINRLKESYAVEVGVSPELDHAVALMGLLQREGYPTLLIKR